jgi:endonuclease YncB( thermonuclease family)
MTKWIAWICLVISLTFLVDQIFSLPNAFTADKAVTRHNARVASIHDGDTISLSIRLAGVDTPELGHLAKCPAEASAAQTARLYVAKQVNTVDRRVTFEVVGSDKYHRTLARVFVDGRDLSEMIIAAGLGRTYAGGKREGWC